MQTVNVKPSEITKKWVVVDAADQPLGRLATEIARVLRGKHKATFTPYLDCGDNVVVINAGKVKFTGNKLQSKTYYHHTSYIGGIKATRAEELITTYPDRIITTAVKGMLPKNKLSNAILKNLRVYAGEEHPHSAQNPEPMPSRTAGQGE